MDTPTTPRLGMFIACQLDGKTADWISREPVFHVLSNKTIKSIDQRNEWQAHNMSRRGILNMSFAATDRKRYCSASGRFPRSSIARGRHLTLLGSLLGLNGSLLTHGSQNDNVWSRLSVHIVDILSSGEDSLVSFSSVLKRRMIFSPISPSGTLTSSLVSPSSVMRER